MRLKYVIAKFLSRFSLNRHEYISTYFRNRGISIGMGCNICSDIETTEPYLVSIGNNTTISTEVLFLNHDSSVGKIFNKMEASDICGKISIGDNCFVGARATILYGVTLTDNIIVAAGSVVTKSFLQGEVIIGGNPAKIISTWSSFSKKIENKTLSLHGKKGKYAEEIVKKSYEKLIER